MAFGFRSEREVSVVAVSLDRKSTRLNSSHGYTSYAVFCLKKTAGATDAARRTGAKTAEAQAAHRLFFFYGGGARRDLHSVPRPRSSDRARVRGFGGRRII